MITLATVVITTLTLAGVTGRHIDGFNVEDDPMFNQGMFEGDILGISSNEDRNAIVDMTQLWPNATVPYVIGESAAGLTKLILEAMDNYHKTTCIKFVPWEINMKDYVRIERLVGCLAFVGRVGGEQKLSLGPGCENKNTVLHELGHTIGLLHEHSRSDRDDFIEIAWENIADEWIKWFQKKKPWENFLLDEPFDYHSVMLYQKFDTSKNRNYTHRPKQPGAAMGWLGKLSDGDIRRINKLYECSGAKRPKLPNVPDVKCDFELDFCGIENEENMDTYFERVTNTVSGRVGMFEGDMVGISSNEDRNAIVDMTMLWPNATVPYVIGESAADITKLILEAMDDYHKNTCIKFVPWERDMKDYVRIERLKGCWAVLGREGGEQNLSLAGPGCDDINTVLHELGHTIGLLHEQNRSDRDDFIEIAFENLADDYIDWFEKAKPWENFLLDEPFDYHSVMLYEEFDASKNGNYTHRPKQPGTAMGMLGKLSDGDIRRINKLYECSGEKRPKVPDVPDLKCDFELDFCGIENQENMDTYFERVTNTVGGRVGTYLEVLKGPASDAAGFFTPYWEGYGRPKTCLSFEYYSDGQSIQEIKIWQYRINLVVVARLDTHTNGRWVKKKIDLTMQGGTMFYVDVLFNSRSPHGRVAFDNLVYSIDNCG